MANYCSMEDRNAIQAEMPWEDRDLPKTVYGMLTRTRDKYGTQNAVTYQITSKPGDKAKTYTWNEMHAKTTQAANMVSRFGNRRKRRCCLYPAERA